MSRPIKFRAWDGNQMCEVRQLQFSPEGEVSVRKYGKCANGRGGYADIPAPILMQFTGLTDRNGVEIYEGDVVTCSLAVEGGGILPHRGEVVFHEGFCGFATKNLSGRTLFHNHLVQTFEVIGNIWESPELLE